MVRVVRTERSKRLCGHARGSPCCLPVLLVDRTPCPTRLVILFFPFLVCVCVFRNIFLFFGHRDFRVTVGQQALDVVSKMLAYDPLKRIKPLDVCSHAFVDEVRYMM